MSARKFRLVLSAPAANDLDGVLAYTLAMWGESQLEKYAAILEKALKKIAASPQSGRAFFGAYFKFAAGEHVIFYRADEDIITIIRILHGRMDASQHLP